MLATPTWIKNQFLNASQNNLILKFSDGTVLDNNSIVSESLKIEQTLCDDEQIQFGLCNAASLEVEVTNVAKKYTGKWVSVYFEYDGGYLRERQDSSITLQTRAGKDLAVTGNVQIGHFKITSEVVSDNKMYKTLTGYDAMADLLTLDVSSWYEGLSFPMTMKAFRTSFFNYAEIEQMSASLPNDSMTITKTVTVSTGGLSGQDVIQSICELNACFGIIDARGRFKYVFAYVTEPTALLPSDSLYPSSTTYPNGGQRTISLTPDDYVQNSLKYEEYISAKITKVQLHESQEDFGVVVGSDGNSYTITGNFLLYGKSSSDLKTIAQRFLDYASKTIYRPAEIELPCTPWVECGDVVRINGLNDVIYFPILRRSINGIVALMDTYSAKGKELYEDNINGLSTQIQQLQAKQIKIEKDVDNFSIELSNKVGTDEIISKINLSTETEDGSTATIQANKVDLTGYVTISDLESESGTTTIAGSHLETGIISDASGNTVWDLDKGTIKSKNFSVNSTNFTLTADGNMTATGATFSGNVYLTGQEGTDSGKIVGNDGMMTNLTFQSIGTDQNYFYGFSMSGLDVGNCRGTQQDSTTDYPDRNFPTYSDVIIPIYLPENFVVYQAYITFFAVPVHWYYVRNSSYPSSSSNTSTTYENWGYPKQLGIGIASGITPEPTITTMNSTYSAYTVSGGASITYIDSCWSGGSSTYTPTSVGGANLNTVKSVDLASYINNNIDSNNQATIVIRSKKAAPSSKYDIVSYQKDAGLGKAFLDIYGYQKFSS